jgi:secreted Zn-dependent insulinase-like peptidase
VALSAVTSLIRCVIGLLRAQGRSMWVVPAVKQVQEVSVSFLLPPLRHLYAKKPEHYLSHLIGHEGPGSILSALKVRRSRGVAVLSV